MGAKGDRGDLLQLLLQPAHGGDVGGARLGQYKAGAPGKFPSGPRPTFLNLTFPRCKSHHHRHHIGVQYEGPKTSSRKNAGHFRWSS